ncbi:FAD-binding protein [Dactylosporangium sp. NPDC049525]|uniref:FAD-binding protein n=1 Tax=Dactylosporangium sp. NPDC049525 TaxID=3154730 RepID=UPI0034430980
MSLEDLLELHPFRADVYSPHRKATLVAAVLAATQRRRSTRAVGSMYSLSDAHVADSVIATVFLDRHLSQPFPAPRGVLPSGRLPAGYDGKLLANICTVAADQLTGRHFVFVEAGIPIRQLLTDLKKCGLALPTMGAGGGQTLAGAVSTGTHGADFEVAPLSDWIRAMLIVGAGGQEFWVTATAGEFGGDAISRHLPDWCADAKIVENDDWLNTARVAVGRLGVVYAVILEVIPDYALIELNTTHSWLAIRQKLEASRFGPDGRTGMFHDVFTDLDGGTFVGTYEYLKRLQPDLPPIDIWQQQQGLTAIARRLRGGPEKPLRHLNIAINLSATDQCWITRRWATSIGVGQANLANPAPTGVAKAVADHPRSPQQILGVLGDMLTEGYSDFELHVGHALGVDAAQRLLDVFFPLMRRIAAESTTSGEALVLILHRLITDPVLGPIARPQVLRGVADALSGDFRKPVRIGHACDMLDLHNYALDGAQSGNSVEFAFDVRTGDHLTFIDRVRRLAAPDRPTVFGFIGLRFMPKSAAFIAMQRFDCTATVEVATGRVRQEDIYADFWNRVHDAALQCGGIPHWGQQFRHSAEDLAWLYKRDLTRWRETVTAFGLQRPDLSGPDVFSTPFSHAAGLEPLSAVSIRSRLTGLLGKVRQLQAIGQESQAAGAGDRAAMAAAELPLSPYSVDDSAHIGHDLVMIAAVIPAGDEAARTMRLGIDIFPDRYVAGIDGPPATAADLQNELAWALSDRLAVRLNQAGLDDPSAAAAREAITLTLELAEATDLDRKGLTGRIIEVAGYLPAQERLDPTQTAVTWYRQLADADPTNPAPRNDLAWALSDRLAVRLNQAGLDDLSAAAAREAITLTLELAETTDLDRKGLTGRIIEVAGYLPTQERLDPTRTAVTWYRQLADADPTNPALRNDLAWALSDRLAVRLNQAGLDDLSAAAAREAITLTLELAETTDLDRKALTGRIIEVAGYLPTQERLDPTRTAVTWYRQLADADPTNPAPRNDLAWALSDRLAVRLNQAGMDEASAAAAREAIKLTMELAATTNLDRKALTGRIIEVAGYLPTQERLNPTQTAVTWYRQLADADPTNPGPRNDLAWALSDRLAVRLDQAGQHEAAEVARQEAAAIRDEG